MSQDINREKNSQQVCSKYFSTKSMDESLTDFQEPKKLAGLKPTSKTAKPDKLKRAPKKIRGQRDIRKALKFKKNELESYSKDFDNVCKQAGLDVDPEQLQLAIALSKSLQQSNSTGESSENSQTNSQDRVCKIRTTLLEYGFKVPDIKITTRKRLKKRKKYKLLLTSEEAKNQIISEKYSQVLFENISLSKTSPNLDVDVTQIQLYNLATNATYSVLKSIDSFYVDGLVEKSLSTGNLLRDWSEIRGRPVSPKHSEPVIMNFSEIECSQDELDIVLSGSLKSCKNVIKRKVEEVTVSSYKIDKKEEPSSAYNLDNSVIVLIDHENEKEKETKNPVEVTTLKTIDNEIVDLEEPVTIVNHCRSYSPDLFDDEPSAIIDEEKVSPPYDVPNTVQHNIDFIHQEKTTNPKLQLSQDSNVTKRCIDMEITDCIEVQGLITNSSFKNSTLKLSQNVTKRKSNDFMEITNCVISEPAHPLIEGDIDLANSQENKENTSISIRVESLKNKCIKGPSEVLSVEVIQTNEDENMLNVNKNIASQHPSNKEILPNVMCIMENSNIDLTDSPDLEQSITVENNAEKSVESLDLTQSSNTSDELPFVSLKTKSKSQSADDTIILDPKEYEKMGKPLVPHVEILDLTQNMMHEEINHGTQGYASDYRQKSQNSDNNFDSRNEKHFEIYQNVQKPDDILDLTQEIVLTSRQNSRTKDTSFFDDYVHNHSDNNDVYNEITDDINSGSNSKEGMFSDVVIDSNNIEPTHSQNIKSTAKHTDRDDIDLTQSSESSVDLSQYSLNKDQSITKESGSEGTVEMEISNEPQSDIDLTQHSESEENRNQSINKDTESEGDPTIEMEIVKSSQRCSSLGKKDDVSIDYDDMYDGLISRHSLSQRSRTSSKSAADNSTSNISNKSKNTSICSQNSQVFEISDNELDYSMHKAKQDKPVDNFLFGGISIMDELPSIASFGRSTNIGNSSAAATANKNVDHCFEANVNRIDHVRTPVKHKRVNDLATPQKPSCSGINTVVTPSNSQYVLKTLNVTPMPKYESMSNEELHSELDKFGVKPFKRKRAIQLLTHIYNQTHPAVEPCSDEESPCKRRKTDDWDSPRSSPRKHTPRKILSPKKSAKSPRKVPESKKSPKKVTTKKFKEISKVKVKDSEESNRLNGPEVIQIRKKYEVDETPVIKEIVCSPDDWVFQKREKTKVHSCRVPLHVAFHNYVYSRRGLREAILCYEPINIDDIHKDLVAYGHRYDPKDLLKFIDKKCITVKTTENDGRNQKR